MNLCPDCVEAYCLTARRHFRLEVERVGRSRLCSKMSSERKLLTEFLEHYRNLPCLWDLSSRDYKDKNKKKQAWELLTQKLKLLEPEANIAMAKKRIEHMRSAYKRESKKVKDSKRTGFGTNEVHVPNLWYYNLFTFLDIKDEQCRSGVDTFASDEESQNNEQPIAGSSRKARTTDRIIERKKQKLIEVAQELLQQNSKTLNTFGIYVGEQLEELSTFQRQVAEKLISEVLFLAKTGNLNFDSKIVTPSRAMYYQPSSSSPPQFFRTASPQYSQVASPPQFIVPSSSPQYIQSSQSVFKYSSPLIAQLPTSPQIKQPPASSTDVQSSPSLQIIRPCHSPQMTQISSSPKVTQPSQTPQNIQTSSSFQIIQPHSPQNDQTRSSPQNIEPSHSPQIHETSTSSRIIQPSHTSQDDQTRSSPQKMEPPHAPENVQTRSSPQTVELSQSTHIQSDVSSPRPNQAIPLSISYSTEYDNTVVQESSASILKEYLLNKNPI